MTDDFGESEDRLFDDLLLGDLSLFDFDLDTLDIAPLFGETEADCSVALKYKELQCVKSIWDLFLFFLYFSQYEI